MSSEEMKQYSENIAIAADEINNENNEDGLIPTADEAIQLKSQTKDKLLIQEEIPNDLENKQMIMKSAESANQAAVDGSKSKKKNKYTGKQIVEGAIQQESKD